jgi:hypothetical protein
MWQTWLKVTTGPNDATFEVERQKPTATMSTALIWMVIAGAVSAAVGFVNSLVFAGAVRGVLPELLAQADLPPEVQTQLAPFMDLGLAAGFGAVNLTAIITVPLFFLIGVGIYHLIAKLLGGQGEFGRYAYLNAAYAAPLGIVASLLSLVPFASCLTIFISIYQIVLAYFATKVEHRLTSGRALLTVLLPVIVVVGLMACAVFSLVALLAQLGQT